MTPLRLAGPVERDLLRMMHGMPMVTRVSAGQPDGPRQAATVDALRAVRELGEKKTGPARGPVVE